MGNSVKTDKEIQLDLGVVGSLSKVGLLGPFARAPTRAPNHVIGYGFRYVT